MRERTRHNIWSREFRAWRWQRRWGRLLRQHLIFGRTTRMKVDRKGGKVSASQRFALAQVQLFHWWHCLFVWSLDGGLLPSLPLWMHLLPGDGHRRDIYIFDRCGASWERVVLTAGDPRGRRSLNEALGIKRTRLPVRRYNCFSVRVITAELRGDKLKGLFAVRSSERPIGS